MILNDCGQAGLGLHRRRKGRTISPGSGLPISAQGNVYDTGIERFDVLVSEAEARERARTKILDDDIGIATELSYDLARFRVVQIEAEISLSGILLNIIEAD